MLAALYCSEQCQSCQQCCSSDTRENNLCQVTNGCEQFRSKLWPEVEGLVMNKYQYIECSEYCYSYSIIFFPTRIRLIRPQIKLIIPQIRLIRLQIRLIRPQIWLIRPQIWLIKPLIRMIGPKELEKATRRESFFLILFVSQYLAMSRGHPILQL